MKLTTPKARMAKTRSTRSKSDRCKHCGGRKDVRNPTGTCDHLYWPDYLTDAAKKANGI